MSSDQKTPSSRPLPSAPANHERRCTTCGSTFISKGSACPMCSTGRGVGGEGEEFVKKVTDDSDLYKGGLS